MDKGLGTVGINCSGKIIEYSFGVFKFLSIKLHETKRIIEHIATNTIVIWDLFPLFINLTNLLAYISPQKYDSFKYYMNNCLH